jgi:hypothetical protein
MNLGILAAISNQAGPIIQHVPLCFEASFE